MADASNNGGSAPPPPAPVTRTSSNPFDFDVDFSQAQQRRAARAARKRESDDEIPIMTAMDVEDEVPKPVAVESRSRTTGDIAATDMEKSGTRYGKWFKRGGKDDKPSKSDGYLSGDSALPSAEFKHEDPDVLKIGKRRLARWPYDDYHLVQKLYYEKLQDGGDEKRDDGVEKNKEANTASSIPILSRPADPPDIPTAVIGLSLSEFEKKAEERAIAIVSTWLFDAGLIDELLVNGGISATAKDNAAEDPSVRSSEGVEIGVVSGAPVDHSDGSAKMDKEIGKLRSSTIQSLAIINSRLNDGVAASGTEVQELVGAVAATKNDMGRLREFSTYISSTADVNNTRNFMLTKYPKLKKAINARRNLARCFRELDFFSQIPITCDKLRDDLHSGEWTEEEWSTLRDVCREHVELEIFLVEAESGMKKRLTEEDEEERMGSRRTSLAGRRASAGFNPRTLGGAGTNSSLNQNYQVVDRFLSQHVKDVWELGDEIRIRIMSGVGNCYELAMNNPAGMVALVEAVEVYESANEEYMAVHGGEEHSKQSLRFTDMRAAALGQIYTDLEMRGINLFRDVTGDAADNVDDEEAASTEQFSAVLHAANALITEIQLVKTQMAPCFPPYWQIEALWTTCVAFVCSSQILQQIGGPEGHKLPDLSVTQLLDLVSWVEGFRETILESYPSILTKTAKKAYLNQKPSLLEDGKVDLEGAEDSLAWVNNVLWEVHDLAKTEFLFRTKEQTAEWLDNVYEAEHTKNQTAEGRLVTSLCEDVYSLAGVQLRTIRERLTRKSEALAQAVGVIFKNLYEKQISCRDYFLTDLETCCAAANDFIRMSEKCEEIVAEIQAESDLSPDATATLYEQSATLLGLYSGDAVYAAQKIHVYIFEPIEEAIAEDLFGQEWLDDLTHNELALTLVRTIDDFMEDLEGFLDDLMVRKSVEAIVSATILFYLKTLLAKSVIHRSNRDPFFTDTKKALDRISGDVQTIREYFDELAEESMPSLKRVISKEFEVMDTVHELMAIGSKVSASDARDFVLVLQKTVRNFQITKYIVGDLWHLVKPSEERNIYDMIDSLEQELIAVAPTDEMATAHAQDRSQVPGLRLDQMLAKHCDESARKRPLKAVAVDKADAVFQKWRATWTGEKDDEQ